MAKQKDKNQKVSFKKTPTNNKMLGWKLISVYFVVTTVVCWVFVFGFTQQYFLPIVWSFNGEADNGVSSAPDTTDSIISVDKVDANERCLDGIKVAVEDVNPTPVAIMFDNIPPAWPQSGLEDASIVYEALVEGGATRLMGVFVNGNAEKIGPIRSARPYFLEWVSEYDALYGHVGGSPEALAAIDGLGINDFSQFFNGQFFWRDTSRYAPHNVYTSSELIQRALRDKDLVDNDYEYQTWEFKDDLPLEERTNKDERIEVHFSGGQTWVSEYVYKRETNSYEKFHAGRPHIDEESGNQLQTKNVVIVIVPEISSYGEKGRITLDISGEGKAFIFRDGQKIEGTWKKPDRISRTLYYDEQGEEIPFNRGTTWISIVPEDRDVIYQESDSN
ncbi:DUF3048 domain-containing protein [Patescibacteria group bacterium]|nr:DUF3048 domain-containing protein [Patescibacteria group bacterium]MBU1891019.1 DUF3048 domain-containing protein [Patescibacteria group bacterium]